MAYKFSNILDYSKLDNLLSTLVTKSEQQQARIEQLEKELSSNRPSNATIGALERKTEESLTLLEKRISTLEQRITQISSTVESVPLIVKKIDSCLEAINKKLDAEEFKKMRTDFADLLDASLNEIRTNKASKDVVNSLEVSQHQILEQMVALQGVLSCKIDKAEVPLLSAASEKLDLLLKFKQEHTARMQRAESDIQSLGKAMTQKDNTSTAVQRIQTIQEAMQTKADVKWINENVFDCLKTMENTTKSVSVNAEVLQKLTHAQDEMTAQLLQLQEKTNAYKVDLTKVAHSCELMLKQVEGKIDAEEFEKQWKIRSEQIQAILQQTQNKAATDSKNYASYLSEVHQSIADLKGYQVTMDKKLAVALQFVKWFTEVKLSMSGTPTT
eukprot:TRINITY_DN9007_c0_g1_i1.p1 TRINITY_DN9007_c0_g1~~TRINITY_DN9007_c0_g1_i1.p1  ORF type:complete len:386 (+),score=63.14 TRINITY_DN9007_c0_g1_i1:16-1173(+)